RTWGDGRCTVERYDDAQWGVLVERQARVGALLPWRPPFLAKGVRRPARQRKKPRGGANAAAGPLPSPNAPSRRKEVRIRVAAGIINQAHIDLTLRGDSQHETVKPL